MDGGAAQDSVCPEPQEEFAWPVRVIGLGIFVFTTVYFAISIAAWFWRREHPMLRKRSFYLMALSAVGLYFNVLTAAFVNWMGVNTFPCDLHAWTSLLVLPLGAGPIVARLVLFYNQARFSNLLLLERARSGSLRRRFAKRSFWSLMRAGFTITRLRMLSQDKLATGSSSKSLELSAPADEEERASSEGSGSITSNGMLALLYFRSHGLVYPMAFVLPFVLIAVVSVTIQYIPEGSPYGRGCHGCTLDSGDLLSIGVMLGLLCIISFVMLYKLIGVADPFRIKFELQVLISLGALLVGSNVLILADPGGFTAARTFDWVYVSNILMVMTHTVQCVLPVLATFGSWRTGLARKEWSFENVVTNNNTRAVFAEYLATEFSVENMWFYDEAIKFEQQANELSDAKVLALAKEIARSFVAEGSIMEINVNGSVRRAIREALDRAEAGTARVPATVFHDAWREVRKILYEDSFPRFQRSKLYAAMITADPEDP